MVSVDEGDIEAAITALFVVEVDVEVVAVVECVPLRTTSNLKMVHLSVCWY